MMTQKPSKSIEARAIGLGVKKELIDRLRTNGIVLVDAAALEKLRAMVEAGEEAQRRLASESKRAIEAQKVEESATASLPSADLGLSTYEAAQFLGMSEVSLMKRARIGSLGFRAQKGKRVVYRFSRSELVAFQKARGR